MRSETYFVRQHSRSTRSHYTVLSATRHHRMEAATFLANVPLVIGSRNGKTAGRLNSSTLLRIVLFRRAPFCVWKCWSILLPLFSIHVSRNDLFLFYLFICELFDPPFIYLFTYSFIRTSVVPQITCISIRRNVYCPITYFALFFFARVPRNISSFSTLVRFGLDWTNLDSWLPRKDAIIILHF